MPNYKKVGDKMSVPSTSKGPSSSTRSGVSNQTSKSASPPNSSPSSTFQPSSLSSLATSQGAPTKTTSASSTRTKQSFPQNEDQPSLSSSTTSQGAQGLSSPIKGPRSSTNFSTTTKTPSVLSTPTKQCFLQNEDQRSLSSSTTSQVAQGLSSPTTKGPKSSTNISTPTKTTSAPSTPTKHSIPQNEVIAYVHHLSPLQRNQKDTMHYSTLTLQTSSNHCQEALLYSKQKRQLLENSNDFHTPVKIQRFTFTSDSKLVINDMTHLSTPNPAEYDFQYKQIQQQPISINEILQSNGDDNVVVRCKLISVAPPKVVGQRNLRVMTATVADGSAEIQLDIWENHIERVQLGRSYQLAPLQIRYWNGKKRLATLARTVIDEITDELLSDIDVQENSEDQLTSLKVPKIKSVENMVYHLYCSNCKRRLLQPSATIAIQCDKCHHIVRTDECQKKLCAKVVIGLVADQDLHLLVYHDTLCSIIPNLSELSNIDIAVQLLSLENVAVAYHREDNVITQILL